MTYYNNETSLTAYYCWDSDDDLAFGVAIYQLLVMFLLPALFMVACYFLVIQELWTSTKAVSALTRPNSASAGQSFIVRWPSLSHQRSVSIDHQEVVNSPTVGGQASADHTTHGRKKVKSVVVKLVTVLPH